MTTAVNAILGTRSTLAIASTALLHQVHAHISTGAGQPLVARIVDPSLAYVETALRPDVWLNMATPNVALEHALVYTHHALMHCALFADRAVPSATPDDSTRVETSAAAIGFLASCLRVIGRSPEMRHAFVQVLAAASFSYRYLSLINRTDEERVRTNTAHISIVTKLEIIDRFMAARDPEWRTARNEPWVLLTLWRPAFDAFPEHEPTSRPRPAVLASVPNFAAFRRVKNNMCLFWKSPHTHSQTPCMVRFMREHPALHAQLVARKTLLSTDVLPGPAQAEADRLMYKAFRIMCTYTDLIDCHNPNALLG